ncbi:outer membrane beta-barrel protein [Olleya sp. YS]|uniref:outer membrane beta-barrel protein n=1 Tax=Olleya sp. YS TaxID=3028318 RepID=UPI0024341E97|nr:outer membrane beta-barrel protein [Olleya sp. YS]WGD35849.1 outer membrane beta-barrel protein [Olleya sp. YS]
MKQLLILTLLFTTTLLFSQNDTTSPEKKFTFGGSVDAYYRTNLTAPNDDNQIAPATSFADTGGFSLGMGNIIASYEKGKVGAVADLVFGPRGEAASATVLNQLFAFYNISENTKLTFGKFNTYLGYEVISPVGNFNYSTSYLFSNGPFSHTGVKVDFSLSEDFSLMLGVFNQTDVTEFNPDGSYAVGAQLGYNGQYLNLLYDKAGLGFEVDYTGGFDASDDFFIGINAAYADNEGEGFYGVDLYPQYSTSDSFTIGLRGEYFQTQNEFVDDDPSVIAITLTGSYVVDEDLIIKPEFRLDSGSEDIFIDTDLMATKSLGAFVLAAIYRF